MRLLCGDVSLDGVDVDILKELQRNSRQTYTAIGKKLQIAHSTVFDRMAKMEQEKVIAGYTVLLDPAKVGFTNIMAMMTVYADPKETEKVAEKLTIHPEVLEVYTSLSDEFMVLAKIVSRNQEELHEFVANSVAPLQGVLRIRTSIVTKKLKETRLLIENCLKGSHL